MGGAKMTSTIDVNLKDLFFYLSVLQKIDALEDTLVIQFQRIEMNLVIIKKQIQMLSSSV